MGLRGPRGKTAKEKKLAGNPGKRSPPPPAAPVASPEPPPICAAPAAPPPWLPDAAQAEWTRAQAELKEPLRPGDHSAFAAYCQSVADLQWSSAVIEREGRLIVLSNGVYGPHPAVKLAAAAMARIKQFASEFGLTPAARSRVPDPPPPPETDALGDFLERG